MTAQRQKTGSANIETGEGQLPVPTAAPMLDTATLCAEPITSPARALQRQLHERMQGGSVAALGTVLPPGQKLVIVACAATASWLLFAALGAGVLAVATHLL